MGRALPSTLPWFSALLKHSTPQHVHSRIQDLQSHQRLYHNRNAKPLPALDPATTIHMQTRRGWEPAIVTGQRREPCSNNLLTPAGKALRRNRQHLRKIHPSLFRDNDLDESNTLPDTQVSWPATTRSTTTGSAACECEQFTCILHQKWQSSEMSCQVQRLVHGLMAECSSLSKKKKTTRCDSPLS